MEKRPITLAAKIMRWEGEADEVLVSHVNHLIMDDKVTWVWDPHHDDVAALVIPDTNIALVVIYADDDWETSIDI